MGLLRKLLYLAEPLILIDWFIIINYFYIFDRNFDVLLFLNTTFKFEDFIFPNLRLAVSVHTLVPRPFAFSKYFDNFFLSPA